MAQSRLEKQSLWPRVKYKVLIQASTDSIHTVISGCRREMAKSSLTTWSNFKWNSFKFSVSFSSASQANFHRCKYKSVLEEMNVLSSHKHTNIIRAVRQNMGKKYLASVQFLQLLGKHPPDVPRCYLSCLPNLYHICSLPYWIPVVTELMFHLTHLCKIFSTPLRNFFLRGSATHKKECKIPLWLHDWISWNSQVI